MGIEFKLARTVAVAPFVADANPNATPPAAADVFSLPDRVPGGSGDKDVHGHSLYVRFLTAAGVEVPGATCDFTAWVKDLGATGAAPAGVSRWTSLATEVGAPSSALFSSTTVGDIFVQLTAVAGVGAATEAEVWVVPRLSVASA